LKFSSPVGLARPNQEAKFIASGAWDTRGAGGRSSIITEQPLRTFSQLGALKMDNGKQAPRRPKISQMIGTLRDF
jgi:hypothetical protein